MDRLHKVDISGLLGGARQLMVIEDEVPIDPFEGLAFPDPVRIALELRQADRMLAIGGCVDARVRGTCDACLEDVDLQVHVDVDERLDPTRGREEDPFGESNVLTGQRLDVADLAQQIVLSALPLGLRCKEDCRGLCGVCGANKNMGECSCDVEQ
ncbi:MAG TPA: DUF177 domain-containing protein [Candidatus Cybelea sp.]|jgi:uncharacterized protein|nr:DUF177 domain-containing protein [Candidatus Cybelea sp.]